MKFIYLTLLLSLFSLSHLFAAERYQLIDLGLLHHSFSEVTSINHLGQVCGRYKNHQHEYIFFWDPDKKINFTNLKISSKPIVNNQSEVFGSQWIQTTDGIWEFEQESLFCWKNPLSYFTFFNFSNLGYPKDAKRPSAFEQERSVLWDVNDQGQMLIMNHDSIKELLAYDAPWSFKYRVWIYDNGKYFQIHEAHFYIGVKINNQSQVLGYTFEGKDIFDKYEKIATSIYDIKENTARMLPFDTTNFGKDINDKGQVAGLFLNPTNNTMQGFFNDPAGETLVFEHFSPTGLNNQDQIIGKFLNGEKKDKPALMDDNQLYDVLELVSLTDDQGNVWDSLDELVDINDKGEIIGQGIYKGATHGFLLKPFLSHKETL